MSKCSACSENIADGNNLTCLLCKSGFHFTCGGLRESAFKNLTKDRKSKWKCPACVNEEKVKSSGSSQPESPSEILTIVQNQNKELRDFIRHQFNDLSKSVQFNNTLIQDLTKTITDLQNSNKMLQEKCIKLETENAEIKKDVKDLKLSIIDLKQYSRRCNLEISNLPESENEKMEEILSKIDELSDTNIAENLIVAHRVPNYNKEKPKPIIIQVKSKAVRDEILKKLKNRKLSSVEINSRFTDTPIYANEHLTPELKEIFFHARKFKLENNFKFCWTKDGKIFLRKNESSGILRIKSLDDLNDQHQNV